MDYFQVNQAIKFWGSIIAVAVVLLFILGYIVSIVVSDIKEKRKTKS